MLAALLREAHAPIARLLIYHARQRSCPAATVAAAEPLRRAFPDALFCTGTDGYFVEINRVRPRWGIADGITYSATPQVHTFDDIAVMENLPGLLETMTTARQLFTNMKLVLLPLTMRPRRNPALPQKDGGPDARQQTLFGAAWMFGALAYCVEGGVARVTSARRAVREGCYQQTANRSFLRCCPFMARRMRAEPGAVPFSDRPGTAVGLEILRGGRFVGIAANLTGATLKAKFTGLPLPCEVSILDEESFQTVRRADDPLHGLPVRQVSGESLVLDLPPYSLAKIAAR